MRISTHLSGGIQTWAMILMIAWTLGILGLFYEWVYSESLNVSNVLCERLNYLSNIVFD